MSVADEIAKLQELHRSGALTDEEFATAKQRLIGGGAGSIPSSSLPPGPPDLAKRAADTRMWAMFIHLSQLCSFLIPFSGIVAPIVIWQIKKAEMPELDVHGRNVTNWIISYVIYMAISAALCFIFVGFLLLPALVVVRAIFAILGGIKANNGEVWEYPLAIKFIS